MKLCWEGSKRSCADQKTWNTEPGTNYVNIMLWCKAVLRLQTPGRIRLYWEDLRSYADQTWSAGPYPVVFYPVLPWAGPGFTYLGRAWFYLLLYTLVNRITGIDSVAILHFLSCYCTDNANSTGNKSNLMAGAVLVETNQQKQLSDRLHFRKLKCCLNTWSFHIHCASSQCFRDIEI